MPGYISKFATGATIEAILNKANNSQSVSIAEKTTWNNKQNALTFDTTPTVESSNPVTSDGIYNYIESKIQYATTDILWSNSNGATVGTEYTMDGNVEDYDIIFLNTSTNKDLADLNQYEQFSVLASMIGSSTIGINSYYQRSMQIAFNGTNFTVLRAVANGEIASEYTPILYKIVGVKFGTGISNNTGTGTSIKTLTYTGDGLATTTITFPETPTVILSIDGPGTGTGMVNLASFRFGANAVSGSWSDNDSGSTGDIALRADYSGDTLLLTNGQNAGARCNVQGATYTVMYM